MPATSAQIQRFGDAVTQAVIKGRDGDVLVPLAFGADCGGGKRFGRLTPAEGAALLAMIDADLERQATRQSHRLAALHRLLTREG